MNKVRLSVGQVWKTRAGDEVAIIRKKDDTFQIKHGSSVTWPYIGSNNISYTDRGTVWEAVSTAAGGDLIELVQDENGWRPWKATANSQCPVAEGARIIYRLANGKEAPAFAGEKSWDTACDIEIVAYKIVEEIPKAEEPVHAEAHSAQHREAQEAPAIRLLQVAADHMRARAATYDKPDGERSMGKTVAAFNAVTGRDLSEAEGWLLLQLLKDVRLFQRPGYHADSAEDCLAYSALKAEAKMAEGA